MELLYRKLFPELTLDELIAQTAKISELNSEMLQAAVYSKKHKLYTLTDQELNTLGDDNYQQQRYMRRCEDAVSESSEENKKGFYRAWDELEEEMRGIQFEVSRRKFLDEWMESRSK